MAEQVKAYSQMTGGEKIWHGLGAIFREGESRMIALTNIALGIAAGAAYCKIGREKGWPLAA